MKLNFRTAINAILSRRAAKPDADDPVSMVLLLRSPTTLTVDPLQSAAEKAFSISFAHSERHFLRTIGNRALLKAGPHVLSFLTHNRPYGERDFPTDFGQRLPQRSQREAWAAHAAWTAVDYVKGGVDLELEYCVLAKLCAELLDTNCTAVWVPREQSLIPNDDSLYSELQRIAAARDLTI
jgi:hypothetical protein